VSWATVKETLDDNVVTANTPVLPYDQDTHLTKICFFPSARVSLTWENEQRRIRALNNIAANTIIFIELPLQGTGQDVEKMLGADRTLADMLSPRRDDATLYEKARSNVFMPQDQLFTLGVLSAVLNNNRSDTPNVRITHEAFPVDFVLKKPQIILMVATTTRDVLKGEELSISYRKTSSERHRYGGAAPNPSTKEMIVRFCTKFLTNPNITLYFVRQRLAVLA
tara:strand:+ start:269 stop:940 length:672 start_codon:yes stop_codon:yes gene_type:complete